jgi:hypothetical protein
VPVKLAVKAGAPVPAAAAAAAAVRVEHLIMLESESARHGESTSLGLKTRAYSLGPAAAAHHASDRHESQSQ